LTSSSKVPPNRTTAKNIATTNSAMSHLVSKSVFIKSFSL
jgi:hypothetical protein